MSEKHLGVEIQYTRLGSSPTNYVSFYVGTSYHGVFYFPMNVTRETKRVFAIAVAELIAASLPGWEKSNTSVRD